MKPLLRLKNDVPALSIISFIFFLTINLNKKIFLYKEIQFIAKKHKKRTFKKNQNLVILISIKARTKRNLKTRFNEHRRDFATSAGKSTFSEHILNAGHEMQPMEETMTILHFENDPRRINALKELEIMRATTSDRMLNTLYRILHSLQDQTMAHADNSWRCH